MYDLPYLYPHSNIIYRSPKPKKDIELKPMKKKVVFAEFVQIENYKDLNVKTDFSNKPCINRKISILNKDATPGSEDNAMAVYRWKTDSIAVQLKRKGVVEISYEKLPPFYLNLSPKITLNDICSTTELFLESLMKTKEEMYYVSHALRVVLSKEKELDAPSVDRIKDSLIKELKATRCESISLEDFGYLFAIEKVHKLSHLTMSKQYYSAYLTYLSHEWESGEEKSFICPLMSPSLQVCYLSAIDELFKDENFKIALERALKDKTI